MKEVRELVEKAEKLIELLTTADASEVVKYIGSIKKIAESNDCGCDAILWDELNNSIRQALALLKPKPTGEVAEFVKGFRDWYEDEVYKNLNGTQYALEACDIIDQLQAEVDKLKELWGAIENNSWDLKCIDVPTGGDDYDIAWIIIEHHMAEPKERQIGYGKTPLEAIEQALKSDVHPNAH